MTPLSLPALSILTLGVGLAGLMAPAAHGQASCGTFTDLWPGPGSSSPTELTYVKGLDRVFFAANHPTFGRELWTSQAGAAGATVLDIGTGAADPTLLCAVGQGASHLWAASLFFAATVAGQPEVWESDGTPSGTRRIAGASGRIAELTDGGSPGVWWRQTVLFTVDRSTTGGGWELWRYERDLRSAALGTASLLHSSPLELSQLHNVGGQTFYRVVTATGDAELWRTFPPGVSRFGAFLWISEMHAEPPYLYFSADDGISGHELWQIHLADPAAHLVEDLAPGSASSTPHAIERLGTDLYYAATTTATGMELRRIPIVRGTATSVVVHEPVPGPGSSNPNEVTPAPFRRLFGGDAGSLLYFSTLTSAGEELWVHEMSTGATRRLTTLDRGKDATTQYGSGEFVVFANRTAAEGLELWCSDGTVIGTRRVCDVIPGSVDSAPDWFTQVGCDLLFVADHPTAGRELFRLPWGDGGVEPPIISKYGSGGVGSAGRQPDIFATHVPRPGQTFGLTLSRSAPTASAVLLLGIGCNQPPITVGPGCSYHLGLGGFVGSVATTDSNGNVTTYITPITRVLPTGTPFTAQFAVLDPEGCFASLLNFTDAMRVVIGR